MYNEEKSKRRDVQLLIFHFRVLKLWELSAEKYVQTHAFALYALLPAMGGASPQLLLRAIEEMVQYYQEDEITLARELRWMGIILRDIIPLEEKRMIEERLSMYDDLMENDPKMRQIRARMRTEGLAKVVRRALRRVGGKSYGQSFWRLCRCAFLRS